jgi:hypothetical protein
VVLFLLATSSFGAAGTVVISGIQRHTVRSKGGIRVEHAAGNDEDAANSVDGTSPHQ